MGNGFPLVRSGGQTRVHGARRPADRPRTGVPAVHHTRCGDRLAGGVPRGGAGLRERRPDRPDGARRAGCWSTALKRRRREEGLADYVQLTGRPSCLLFITRDADDPVAGLPHAVPAGAASTRRAGPVVRHLGGAHRCRHRAAPSPRCATRCPLPARHRAGLGRRAARGPSGCSGDPPVRRTTPIEAPAAAARASHSVSHWPSTFQRPSSSGNRALTSGKRSGSVKQHPIRFRREEFIRRHDRDVGAWHPPALFGGRRVGDRRK